MFTPAELRERMYEALKPRNRVPVEATGYGAGKYGTPPSETLVVVHRAPATIDPVRFWVSSVVTLDGWSGRGGGGARSRYIKESLCRPLTEQQFNQLVADHGGAFVRPGRLPLHRTPGAFAGAMQMHEAFDDLSALAAYEDELIAFYYQLSW